MVTTFNKKSFKNIQSHGRSLEDIKNFHSKPDYFWVIDADEIYDADTIPSIIDYLYQKKPAGMRITGYNYLRNWNRRIPREVDDFTHFGFIKPGLLFEQRRVITWNESRLSKLLKLLHLPDWSTKIFGFITCPESTGVFHHGCWLGDNDRISEKFLKSSHKESQEWSPGSVDGIQWDHIPTVNLPVNIQHAEWPEHFFDNGTS